MPDPKKIENGQAGFTLLEVMVGLAILGGVLVTVAASLNYHMGVAEADRKVVVAAVLGKSKAEEFILSGAPAEDSGGFGSGFQGYNWKASKKEVEVMGLERIDLKVTWDKNSEMPFILYLKRE